MKSSGITLIKRGVLITITAFSGIFIWVTFSPRRADQPVYSKYQFLDKVKTYQVEQDEIFSEEVDTIFYDKLGLKNVRFKQNYINQ